jgi:ribosomal protein L16/L10AE
MASDSGRTVEQIREEIRLERAQLEQARTALTADVKRSGQIAGSVLAALGSLRLLLRLRSRRR